MIDPRELDGFIGAGLLDLSEIELEMNNAQPADSAGEELDRVFRRREAKARSRHARMAEALGED